MSLGAQCEELPGDVRSVSEPIRGPA